MQPTYFVINIDSDPDPEDTPRDDVSVMRKYRAMLALLKAHAGGKGTICVHTSGIYRDRFFEPHFMEFWREWVEAGGALTLHPEEDLYAVAGTRPVDDTLYSDFGFMEPIIREKAAFMREAGLPFAAYKGGYHGLTMPIVNLLMEVGIEIELTCAPDIHWPTKSALWGGAPTSAYYMSTKAYGRSSQAGMAHTLFEIPFGWDGVPSDTTTRFLMNEHYLVNEFSTFDSLCRVWDAVVERGKGAQAPQFVSFLAHTYTMEEPPFAGQLAAILDYMQANNGVAVTATEAKAKFDALHN